MRLRPPMLDHPGDGDGNVRICGLRLATHAATTSDARSPGRRGRQCPHLRSAPGYSCGYDLRCSITRETGTAMSASAVCAWLLMRLRPPMLDHPGDGDGNVRICGLRLATHAATTSDARSPGRRGRQCPHLRSAPGYSCGYDLRC